MRKSFLLTGDMSRESANSEKAGVFPGVNRCDAVSGTAHERAFVGSTWINSGLVLPRTSEGYRRKCTGLVDVQPFIAIEVGCKSLAFYGQNCF